MIYLLCLVLGIVAGLRAFMPLAALSLGASLGWIDLSGTWATFLSSIIAAAILVVFAVLELVGDKLPQARSRKLPPSFAVRVVSGALAGAVLGLPSGNWLPGLVLGAGGALIGTLGGFEVRRWLAARFRRDLPAALVEDSVAVSLALIAAYAA